MQTPPPVNPAIADLAGKILDAKEAAIPGPVIDAMLPEGIKIGPFFLPPPHLASLLLLHSADSPFVTGRTVTHSSLIMDLATAVHVLATDWKVVKDQVSRGEISERIWETMAAIPVMAPEEMQAAVAKIAAYVNKGFATALAMGRAGEADAEGGEAEPQKKTQASVGGSSSSDGSASATT